MRSKILLNNVKFRVTGTVAPTNTPISLRSVGDYLVLKGWKDKTGVVKDFVQLFFCISGSGEFIIENKKYLLEAGFATYYYSGEPHLIKAVSPEWRYCWFTFDGKLADELMKNFNFPRQPFYAEGFSEKTLQELYHQLADFTPDGTRMSGALVYAIMASMGRCGKREPNDKSNNLVKQFIALVEANYMNETVNINSIVDILGVHRTTLTRALKDQIDMTPGDYLINVRIQHALIMLRETKLSIARVGAACGIADPCYFSKIIKDYIGISPHDFRTH
jgi:AraC family transcriptional regulator, arabinose operon regulatory protein